MKPYPRVCRLFLFLAICIADVACQRSSPAPVVPTPATDSSTKDTSTATIYVLGLKHNSDSTICWKNSVPRLVSTDPLTYCSNMIIVDTDVYISGGKKANSSVNSAYAPCYWKNGVQTSLPDTTSTNIASTNGIAVSGSDVYVSGLIYYNDTATVRVPYIDGTPPERYAKLGSAPVYWKNGIQHILPGTAMSGMSTSTRWGISEYASSVSGICSAGGDVYISGGSHEWYTNIPSSQHFTTYWKNGFMTDLYTSQSALPAGDTMMPWVPYTSGICVSGNDFYVAGGQYLNKGVNGPLATGQAVYWKNGVPTYLNTDAISALTEGICVSGSDVYVCGSVATPGSAQFDHAAYWKNGDLVTLPDNSATNSRALFIAVRGSDVYVAGWITGSKQYYVVWKNGQPTTLMDVFILFGFVVK